MIDDHLTQHKTNIHLMVFSKNTNHIVFDSFVSGLEVIETKANACLEQYDHHKNINILFGMILLITAIAFINKYVKDTMDDLLTIKYQKLVNRLEFKKHINLEKIPSSATGDDKHTCNNLDYYYEV